jgi:hypothetical protein
MNMQHLSLIVIQLNQIILMILMNWK